MYLPKHFSVEEWKKISDLIQQNSFATILSYPTNDKPFVNHLPIIFDVGSQEENILIGHMAKRNPQWNHFKENSASTIIFHGPHTYISPRWYRSGRDVPTWNYAVVHLHGKIELIEDFERQVEVLKKLTQHFEGDAGWQFELPDDLLDEKALTSAIISFKIKPEKIEAKFKLSQNRSDQDRLGVIEGLRERTDEMSAVIRKLMETK